MLPADSEEEDAASVSALLLVFMTPPRTELADPAAVLGKLLPDAEAGEAPRNLDAPDSLSRRPPKKGFCTAIGSP
ncbi:hypothetical protein GCM10027082_10180 [Comamonas humi]